MNMDLKRFHLNSAMSSYLGLRMGKEWDAHIVSLMVLILLTAGGTTDNDRGNPIDTQNGRHHENMEASFRL